MYKGEIDFEYMKIKANETEIINEIIRQLYRKKVTQVVQDNNTIKFNGGILSGIIFNWCLLTGITKGTITVKNNTVKYSLSFIETYLFFGFLVIYVTLGMFFLKDKPPFYFFLFPIIFFVVMFIIQENFGSRRFRKFLHTCISKVDKKAKEDLHS